MAYWGEKKGDPQSSADVKRTPNFCVTGDTTSMTY